MHFYKYEPPFQKSWILQHARTSICWHACSSVHAYLVGLDLFLSWLPSTAFLYARSDKTMGPRRVCEQRMP